MQCGPRSCPVLYLPRGANADRGFPDVAVFELGPLYRDDTPEGQALVAAGPARGANRPEALAPSAAREIDLYDVKTDALAAPRRDGCPRRKRPRLRPIPRRGTTRGGPAPCGWAPRHSAPSASCTRRCWRHSIARPPIAGFEIFLDRGAGTARNTGEAAASSIGIPGPSSATSPSSSTASCRAEDLAGAPPTVSTASSPPRSAYSTSTRGAGLAGRQEIAGDHGRASAAGSVP